MKQTTKRFLSMIISLALIVAAFLVLFDLIQPAYGEVQQIRSEQISRENFLAKQRAAVEQVKNLITATRSEQELQRVLSLALPTQPDPAGAIAQLDGIAEGNRLALKGLSISLSEQQASGGQADQAQSGAANSLARPLGSATFQIRFASTYEDMKAFLRGVETNLRLFDVRSINLQPPAKIGDTKYDLEMVLETYYQTPFSPPAPPARSAK
ncbi:MAG: hypothetical protein HY978_03120 [Candidatus Liptonbacteria bacterium]|nr:hypothetical protein [Candidatus Liptonbacteria bacterium]